MPEQTQSYFDQLMGMTDDEVRKQKQALARRTIKRQLMSARDELLRRKLDMEQNIGAIYDGLRRNVTLHEHDLQNVIDDRAQIKELSATMEIVEAEYKHLFGEDMPEVV